MNKTAVLILNYNGKRFLNDCFSYLEKQTKKGFDIYLIDNDSIDNSVDYTRKKYPKIKIIAHKKNLGFTGGYNVVLKTLMSKYQYLVLLNNDTKVDKFWFEELYKTAQTYKNAGIITSTVCDWQGKNIETAGGKMLVWWTGTNTGYGYKIKVKDFKSTEPFAVFYASGASMLIKSWALKKVGYLDEGYFAYWEDIDICWRANLADIKVICNPKSVLCHFVSGTAQSKPYSYFLSERNRLLTYYKNLSTLSFLVILLPLILSRLILALIFYKSWGHFIEKVKGLVEFFYQIPNYRKIRSKIQRLRKISDWQMFKINSTTIIK